MRWTQAHIPTLREDPVEAEVASHRLMLRAGLIRKLSSGVYSYLPLGQRVLLKVIAVIREAMNAAGAQEVLLPALQPEELWKRSGRAEAMGQEMIRFKDRHGKLMVLGPTHEEVITNLVAGELRSYRQLPINLYQIQTKFRDEPRPRFGVIRSSEFLMKDAYSFDRDTAGLDRSYQAMYETYEAIFRRCDLPVLPVLADTGVMGGSDSHEFMVPAAHGEDEVVRCACGYAASRERAVKTAGRDVGAGAPCPQCGKPLALEPAIEVGHIFKLGAKYTQALGATFLDEDGAQKPLIMGCYGIGVSRILPTVIETHHDDAGIQWPAAIAPYTVDIVPLNVQHTPSFDAAQSLYQALRAAGVDAILDDRDDRAGVKLKDADLIGFPIRVVISEKTLAQSQVEVKIRATGQTSFLPLASAAASLPPLVSPLA
ncbi:MAG: proline--tRNA ligase [Candidatus Omnitrophica bacterium]|nr:proline--tRNA ligase [Candidatus Omnitrophota bacterium]